MCCRGNVKLSVTILLVGELSCSKTSARKKTLMCTISLHERKDLHCIDTWKSRQLATNFHVNQIENRTSILHDRLLQLCEWGFVARTCPPNPYIAVLISCHLELMTWFAYKIMVSKPQLAHFLTCLITDLRLVLTWFSVLCPRMSNSYSNQWELFTFWTKQHPFPAY